MRTQNWMLTGLFIIILCIVFIIIPSEASTQELNGLQIIEKQKELQEVQDEWVILKLELIDAKDRVRVREIETFAMQTTEGLYKGIIRFLLPADVRGTALLVWEHKERDNDQWLYLPELRKEKRLVSGVKKNKFMGTDFAYEDLQPEKLSAYEYNLVGTGTQASEECFIVEALPATQQEARDSGYAKRKLWIRKDIYSTVKVEFYDEKNNLIKVLTNSDLENIAGTAWRPTAAEMDNIQENRKTRLTVKEKKANQGLSEDLLTVHMLGRFR